jgi:DNA-directed RNA polymerase sigma subunit (sigma70/sigma32)
VEDLIGTSDQDEPLQAISQSLLEEQINSVLKTLSEQEAHVAWGFAEGKSWSQLARELGVTRYALDKIRAKAFSKLRCPDRSLVLRDYLDD